MVYESDHAAILSLFVHTKASNPGLESESSSKTHKPNLMMVYVWQCPVMLMSWSWVFFYAGFILHILTPVIPPKEKKHEVQVRLFDFESNP